MCTAYSKNANLFSVRCAAFSFSTVLYAPSVLIPVSVIENWFCFEGCTLVNSTAQVFMRSGVFLNFPGRSRFLITFQLITRSTGVHQSFRVAGHERFSRCLVKSLCDCVVQFRLASACEDVFRTYKSGQFVDGGCEGRAPR